MSGSVTNCVQCDALTKSGERCKLRTCKYAQKCFHHNSVLVKKSSLPGSGLGLFTKKEYKIGETIGEYKGTLMTKDAFDRQRPESDYGLEVKKDLVIDAKNTQSSTMRYANDARGSKKKNNARFSTNFKRPIKVNLVAKSNISKWKEIFVSYGRAYWK